MTINSNWGVISTQPQTENSNNETTSKKKSTTHEETITKIVKRRLSNEENQIAKKSKVEKMSLDDLPRDMRRCIFRELDLNDLIKIGKTSKTNHKLVKNMLVDRLNQGEINSRDLRIKQPPELPHYLGSELMFYFGEESCKKISTLDLHDYEKKEKVTRLTCSDVDLLSKNFPTLTSLSPSLIFFNQESEKEEYDPNVFSYLLKKYPNLTSLKLQDVLFNDCIKNIENAKLITNLEISYDLYVDKQNNKFHNQGINISFLENLNNLKYLKIKGLKLNIDDQFQLPQSIEEIHLENINLTTLKFLENCRNLKKITISNCINLVDLKFPANVEMIVLTQLDDLSTISFSATPEKLHSFTMDSCKGMFHFNFIENAINIRELNLISVDFREVDMLLLKHLSQLEKLQLDHISENLQSLNFIGLDKFSCLKHLSLSGYNLGVRNENDQDKPLNFSDFFPNLKELSLKTCYFDINQKIQNLPELETLQLENCENTIKIDKESLPNLKTVVNKQTESEDFLLTLN